MATGQMKGTDEYDFVVEIDIPDEVMQHYAENNQLSPNLHLLLMKK